MKSVYLSWQDPKNRQWFPVGKLSYDDGVYKFVYTKGARLSSNFTPFGRMQDLTATYKSNELFPLFANRLISKKRPEYKSILEWLDLQEAEADPLALLARTEGIRVTDSLTVFPCPEPDAEGRYRFDFFSHGLRYRPVEAIKAVNNLKPGDRLYLMPDPQNRYDNYAIALRTDDPTTIVGYCPRYITKDFLELLKHDPDAVCVTVKRVNPNAPLQLRLLCSLVAKWPTNFKPCSDHLYEELSNEINPYNRKAIGGYGL